MEPESIKWPTEFSELQSMDSAFKCGICYDYMKTSMITLCSHTYCSLCIRKFLQYSAKCPTCFIETHENDLRNNRPLDNIIMLYLGVRNKLLKALRVAEAASRGSVMSSPAQPSNQSSQVTNSSNVTPKSGIKAYATLARNTFEKTPVAKNRLFPPESPQNLKKELPQEDVPESLECKVPLMFTTTKPNSILPSKNKAPVEKAQCPVCQVEIPSRNINLHLDACLDRSTSAPKEVTAVVKSKKRDPLPKRLYHMMNDRLLKQELKGHGLSVQGDRKAWLNRIRRFIVLYNSETDADNPRPVSAIIHQLEREEREEKKKENPLFKSLSQRVDRYSNPDAIVKANKQYIEDNKDSFKRMIEEMKNREVRNIRPPKPINLIESDEETDKLEIIGGVVWDPEAPSTSATVHLDNGISNDAAAAATSAQTIHQQENQLDNALDAVNSCTLTSPSSPNEAHLLSESSVDSVFDFSSNRTVLSSCTKKSVKRKLSRKSRTPSPDPFNETSSVISEHCYPDANLYQSIFGDDENNGEDVMVCRSSNCVTDEMECSSADKSVFSLDIGSSSVENIDETNKTTPVRTRRKRATKTPLLETIPSNQRPRRYPKKQKSSPT